MKKRVLNSQIPWSGPRIIRGKGTRFGSYTPVRTHGVVFRELWVSALHPHLGCFSKSCTGPNETCPPPPPGGGPQALQCFVIQWRSFAYHHWHMGTQKVYGVFEFWDLVLWGLPRSLPQAWVDVNVWCNTSIPNGFHGLVLSGLITLWRYRQSPFTVAYDIFHPRFPFGAESKHERKYMMDTHRVIGCRWQLQVILRTKKSSGRFGIILDSVLFNFLIHSFHETLRHFPFKP